MEINENVIQKEEQLIIKLQQLFDQYSYTKYKMSKFEEYDLYSRNKDFLISDNIITFTDTTGKLLALKPDVTLSIVKNSKQSNGLQKVYYNENVYRVSKFTKMFKEIRQVGIEALGEVDEYTILETLIIALKSLSMIDNQYQLSISHLGILKQIVETITDDKNLQSQILKCIDDKNIFELKKLVEPSIQLELLEKLLIPRNNLDDCIDLMINAGIDESYYKQLTDIINVLESLGYHNYFKIDFSISCDLKYYNGVAFKGYISGLPTRVLAGGQYDNLMKRMKKNSKAIGFAIYMDLLERLSSQKTITKDVAVIYNEKTNLSDLAQQIQYQISLGKSVIATRINDIEADSYIDLRKE